MKEIKKSWLIFSIISLIFVNLCVPGWAEDESKSYDPITDEWNMVDLLIARPLGIVAGVLGTGVFVLSLPFTIPTNSVNDAAHMFIVKPFKFSFSRKFPDENIHGID